MKRSTTAIHDPRALLPAVFLLPAGAGGLPAVAHDIALARAKADPGKAGTLSGPGGPAPTYLDMMRHNATTIAKAPAP